MRDPKQLLDNERVDGWLAKDRGHRCCWLLRAR